MAATTSLFSRKILAWFEQHGRHDLPWQIDRTPYRVWVSEIMLQQTQVSTVIPYYQRFMKRFATVQDLAAADTDQVLHLWTGLGYYARARNLHKAAKTIVKDYQRNFPQSVERLIELPGIGQSTAAAIAAISMNIRAAILDGNVKRVLTRYYAIEGWPEKSAVNKELWKLAESVTPQKQVADYSQAIMDLGATVCTRSAPSCTVCPLHADCSARKQSRVAEFPGKKKKKALPVKSTAMFILQNEAHEVLLEKRPATGIWGSLYSLPESADARTSPDIGQSTHNKNKFKKLEALPTIRHSFSHYHLDITPVLVLASNKLNKVAETDRWLWYPLDHSMEVGLAAPVKKLLSQLAEKTCLAN